MGEAFAWLKKMAAAARQLNYAGTIVYQHRNHVETSRVAHFVNSAGGELEKLETLDGPAREVIRSNDQVVCYLPNVKTVLIEERNRAARNFPALVPESVHGLSESYQMRMEDADRVAGHDCRWIGLVPRDQLRYGRRFCAEVGSGFPLRAQTLNEKGDAVESFAFTQLTIGAAFTRDQVRSRYADASKAQKWKVERSGFNGPGATPAETGWVLTNPLAGFRKIMEGEAPDRKPRRRFADRVFRRARGRVGVHRTRTASVHGKVAEPPGRGEHLHAAARQSRRHRPRRGAGRNGHADREFARAETCHGRRSVESARPMSQPAATPESPPAARHPTP